MRAVVLRTALVLAMLPVSAGAQTMPLTESQALAQLAPEHPRVLAARAGVDVARADILAAARWPNPRVTYNREAVASVAEHMLLVAQPLPITGRRRLEVHAATARVEASSARAEDRVRRVRADVRLAFTNLWAAQEREAELARSRDRLDGLAAILATRETAGDAAGFDRLRAEREVFDVETSRAVVAAERAQAHAMLTSLLTAPRDTTVIEAMRPSPSRMDIPAVDALMARAETSRGDLVALARETDAARFAEQVAGRQAIPEPEVIAGTKTSNAAGGDIGSVVSVHVGIPLFDRGQPERAAARARDRQVRAEAAVLRQTIHAQITAWRAAVIERRTIADRHRAAMDAGTAQIERIAQVSYDAGERGILDLLDAYRTGAAARVRQTELDAAVREAEIELEFVSGWEMP